MQSPIPDTFWKSVFHVTVCTAGACCLYSLWNQRSTARGKVNKELKFLASNKARKNIDSEDVEDSLRSIIQKGIEDTREGSAGTRLAIQGNIKTILAFLKLDPDNDDSVTNVKLALQCVQRFCGVDEEGRAALARADGYKRVLAVLSLAHKHREKVPEVLDLAAEVLCDITSIEEREVVLDGDVPRSAQGTRQLCHWGAMLKMLRTLDPEGRTAYLQPATGCFSHICTLREGAASVAKGTDNISGIGYFLALLGHAHPMVVENSVRAIRHICNASDAAKTELCDEVNVCAIVALLHLSRSAETIHQIIATFLVMLKSKKHKAMFFPAISEQGGFDNLIKLWTRSSEAQTRAEAELILHVLGREPMLEDEIQVLMEQNHMAIRERKTADEQAMKRQEQMQQMRQQMMFQQMMMGGGGPGGPGMGDMMDMMGDE